MTPILPELHDLGKLAAEDMRGRGHSFHDRSGVFLPGILVPHAVGSDLSWLAIIYHMTEPGWSDWVRDLRQPAPLGWIGLEERRALFLVCLADHLAATTVRAVERGPGRESWRRLRSPRWFVLWRGDSHPGDPYRIKSPSDLEQLIEMWERQSADAVLRSVEDAMRARAEDEAWPNQVTSLWAHSMLTGRYFRILDRYVEVGTDGDGPFLSLAGTRVRSLKDACEQWEFSLAQVKVKFHQSFARAMDVAVLRELQELLDRYEDPHVLLACGTTLYFFLPDPSIGLRELLEPFTARGFYAEARLRKGRCDSLQLWRLPRAGDVHSHIIGALDKDLQARKAQVVAALGSGSASPKVKARLGEEVRVLDGRIGVLRRLAQDVPQRRLDPADSHKCFYPPEVERGLCIEPPLCDVCQVRRGVPRQVGTVTEHLCDRCWEFRDRGFRQADLRRWEERESKACWICLSLDSVGAEELVEALYGGRVVEGVLNVRQHPGEPLLSEFRPLGVLWDLHQEFAELVRALGARLEVTFGERVDLAHGVWIAELRQERQVLRLLRDYIGLVRRHFPVLLEPTWREGPVARAGRAVRLGVSYGPASWPFYVYWRQVSEPPQAVSVRSAGGTRLETSLAGLGGLVAAMSDWIDGQRPTVRSYLHTVAAVERKTGLPELAWATVKADSITGGPVREVARELVRRFEGGIRQQLFGVAEVVAMLELSVEGEGPARWGGRDAGRVHA